MKKKKNKFNIKKHITEEFLKSFKEKNLPPWENPTRLDRFPMNPTTKVGYRGINIFYLCMLSSMRENKSAYFMTFKQASALGAKIKKGSIAYPITYNKRVEKEKEENSKNLKPVAINDETNKTVYFLAKYYNVFSTEDIEDLPKKYVYQLKTGQKFKKDQEIEKFIKNTGANISHAALTTNGCYLAKKDKISMAPINSFKSKDAYYRVIFHELVHWTGAKKRLNRNLSGDQESEAYWKEEITAEFGAAMIAYHFGMKYTTNHTQYIKHYLSTMEKNKNVLFSSASNAQKAFDYLISNRKENNLE